MGMREADLNKERLELALEAAGLDLWENNLITGNVTLKASKTFLALGFSEEEVVSHMNDLYGLIHPDDQGGVRKAVADLLSGGSPQYRCEFRLRAKSGGWVWHANYGRIMDAGGSVLSGERLIGVTFNIDDRKRREDEIAQINRQLLAQNQLLQLLNATLELLAANDGLTGLTNRRTLMTLGANEFQRTLRFGHPLSLLMVDIDLFKAINDNWGHLAGDRVICAVASVCDSSRRNGVDVVARWGGEEFVILLPETMEVGAMHLAETLRSEVEATKVLVDDAGTRLSVTVSIGVATLEPRRDVSFESLLHRADKALYRAKNAGRNAVHCAEALQEGAPLHGLKSLNGLA